MAETMAGLLRDSARLLPRQDSESPNDNPPPTSGSAADQLLQDLQNPFQTQLQAQSIWIALGYSIGAMILICLLFSLIRPYNAAVYAPKVKHADTKHAPPAIGRGFFSWVSPVLKTKEEVLVEKIGLDAAIFLRFTRMCRNILLALSIVGCGILIPVHITQSFHWENAKTGADQAFADMTPQNVMGQPLWSHVVVSYVFDFIIMYFLWSNYRAVARLKKAHFLSIEYQNSLHARSIWVTDIAKADRSDEGILRIADAVEQTAGIPRAAIARNVKELPILIKEHTEMVKKLESILAKYLKNPDSLPSTRPTMRPSKKDHRAEGNAKVDAIEYLTNRIKDLEVEIKDVRESIDKRNPLPYGFATYDRIDEASRVAHAGKKNHPGGAMIRLAPKPSDLIWDNLPLLKKTRRGRSFMMDFWIALLTVLWIAPNALIAIFLSNLTNLKNVWPAFSDSANANPTLWAIVQAIASPALLSLIYILLPILFRRLSTRAGDLTKTLRERHVTQKLFAFFVFNNLIVFSTLSTLTKFVGTVVKESQSNNDIWVAIGRADFANILMQSLCTVSPFWVTYLLQRQLGAAVDLAQLINLFWRWFARTFMSPTPRQQIEWTAPDWFDYASYYNYFLFYTTVCLCYATIQPIVLPVTALYFVIDAWLKKYLLMYIYVTKTESGGQLWNIIFNRFLFATLLANVVAALVVKGGWPNTVDGGTTQGWIMTATMVPLPLILLAFKLYCKRTFADKCKYYHCALPAGPEDHPSDAKPGLAKRERIGVKFGHPAIYASLITPMVHARAQHALAQVYSGRTTTSDAADYGYAEYAMDPMSNQQPGKRASAPAAPAAEMFEVVPASNLDFGYFKDRADFAEEHGGAGELFGRPADLVSERGPTPRPFTPDGSSIRSQTPPAMPGPGGYYPHQQHPPYRPAPQRGYSGPGGPTPPPQQQQMYSMPQANDSRRGLLRHAQGPARDRSMSPDGRPTPEGEQPPYVMDRWRAGGRGYFGVSGQADDDIAYEPYRPAARPPGGY